MGHLHLTNSTSHGLRKHNFFKFVLLLITLQIMGPEELL
jgi:hypothetical protein